MAGGKGKTKSQITGYKYSLAVHFGLGRGPLNQLTEIRAGDLVAWSGILDVTDSAIIDKTNLFGGDEKEGGLSGAFKLMMGYANQEHDSFIYNNLDGGFPVPGWRGVASLLYSGQICSNNPYPKPWKFRVNRTTKGWDTPVFLPDLATINTLATPLTMVTFNLNPRSGDTLFIGEVEIGFYTYVIGEPQRNVTIGADAEATAAAFAKQMNAHSAEVYGAVAEVTATQVTLQFPDAVPPGGVRPGYGDFLSISNTGGSINAMNPAHIIYECATNNVWGRGLPESLIDGESFRSCAATLWSEGFGLCLRWNRQEDIDKFVASIVNHVGAAVYIHRQTGLLTMKLIRADYDPDTLDQWTFENGMLDIIEDSSSSADTTFNEVIVAYVSPLTGKRGTVRVHNIGSFQALGTTISTTVEYLGVPTASLALRLAQRDLEMQSSDLRRLKVKLSRAGWYIAPADVIKIHAPSRGIENMILRVGMIEDGPLEEETITITAIQDIFSLPQTSFVKPQPSYWIPPDRTPRPIADRLVDEATYYDLADNLPPGELEQVQPDNGMIKVFAAQPTGFTIDYLLSTKTTMEASYVDRTLAGFDANADLVGSLALHGTSISYANLKADGLIDELMIPVLLIDPSDHTKQEYVRLEVINKIAGTATVARGTIDTIPQPWPPGTKIWFQTNVPTSDLRSLSASETAQVKLIPRTSSDELDRSLAPVDEVDIGGRQGRPYPPGNLQINGAPFELSQVIVSPDEIALTWAHRDRITQSSFLIDHTAGNVGPEPGTTYTVEMYDAVTGTLIRSEDNISGTAWTYTSGWDTADGNPNAMFFRVFSERADLPSWQAYEFTVRRSSGFDEDFDFNFDGGVL